MDSVRKYANIFYVITVLYVSVALLLLVSPDVWPINLISISYQDAVYMLQDMYFDERKRMVLAIFAGVLIFLNFIFFKCLNVSSRNDKAIAFDNPSGRVSVSLTALEEMVKRVLSSQPEIKESKPNIRVSKRGIQVRIRLNLYSGLNIPEVTAKVQKLVLRKIQDTIGIDEPVHVMINVGKILPERFKSDDKKAEESKDDDDKLEPNIPFHGYRA